MNIQQYIEKFEWWTDQYPGPVPYCIQFNANEHSGHVVFSVLVHGDETGAVPALLDVVEKLHKKEIVFGGKVSFVLGNIPAALQNKRFLDTDLNRSFGPSSPHKDSVERARALSLMPLLNDCDVLFDFHQTALPTKNAFYAFGFQRESYLWARIAGCTPLFVTRKSGKSFSSAGMCIDEYVRSLGKPAVTLELSQRGFTTQAYQLANLAMHRVLKAGDRYFSKQKLLNQLANKNIDLKFFITVHREAFSHPKKRLMNGLLNFTAVHKNQNLGIDENDQPIVASHSGFILFPKYPVRDAQGNSTEIQSELFILCRQTVNDFFDT